MSIAKKCINGVCVCIIPLPDNDHRPLALRHGALALMAAVLIVLKVFTTATLALSPTPAYLSTITTSRIVQLTNNERVSQGQHALSPNNQLNQAAREKGEHMLAEQYFAHISPSGVTPWFWINKAGYEYSIAGENLAIDFTIAEDVVAAWMASPSHRNNILNSEYTETGVAVVSGEFQGSTSIIVVHMFGKPLAQAESATVPSPEEEVLQPAPVPAAVEEPRVIPPQIPALTLDSEKNQLRHELELVITGEPGSLVQIVINGQNKDQVTIPETGSVKYSQDISDLPDGELDIYAYALNREGGRSEISESLHANKHTVGPEISTDDIVMILSPGIDRPDMALRVTSGTYHSVLLPGRNGLVAAEQDKSWLALSRLDNNIPINLVFSDDIGNDTEISLSTAPSFTADTAENETIKPARFTSLTRNVSLSILVSVAILLTLSIVIRINVQRPGLIAHSLFIIILAGMLLLF